MIENLQGIHETVNFKANTNLRLYHNTEFEDYPLHWHTPLEIIMPTENDYTVTCSNHTFHLNTGDILLICPGVIHSLVAPLVGQRIIFQAELSMLHQMKEFESILSLLTPAFYISPDTYPSIHGPLQSLLYEISDEYSKEAPLSEAMVYSKLIELFVIIARNHKQNTTKVELARNKQKEYTEKFIVICNYINDHCCESLSLDQIAKIAGFSKYHFTRLFKQFTNVTFYKYLNTKRISLAESLLINPELTITEVAYQCGFSSISSFIRMFKLIKFCTPTEFRNMYTS